MSALRSFSPSSRSRLHLRGVGVDLKKPALRSQGIHRHLGVVDTVVMVKRIIELIRDVYRYTNVVYDFVSRMVQGKAKLLDIYHHNVDLLEAITRGGIARV